MNVDELLAQALGYASFPGQYPRRSGRQTRYAWRVSCTDGWFDSASLMVVGYLNCDDPDSLVWRSSVPTWRAALGVSLNEPGRAKIITADLTDDPVIAPLTAVRWCHLSPFQPPVYGKQLDGTRMSLSFWTAENAGMNVSVELPSTACYYRRSVARVRRAAIDLADRVARTSEDAAFRSVVAACFPGAGAAPGSVTPSPEELSQYLARLRQWWKVEPALTEGNIEDCARDLWRFGIAERQLPELLPGYPPELAERVLPVLRQMNEDSDA